MEREYRLTLDEYQKSFRYKGLWMLCRRLTAQYFDIGGATMLTMILSTERDPDSYYIRCGSQGSPLITVSDTKKVNSLIARHFACWSLRDELRGHFGGAAWLSVR